MSGANRRFDLPTALFESLSRSYSADLSGVKLSTGPAAERLAGDAVAVCVDGQIFLGERARAPGAPPILAVIAHEAAHAVQQRRGRLGQRLASSYAAEREACDLAMIAVSGRRAAVRLALDWRAPAAWEEVGHYYTTYYVLLSAGVRDPMAKQIAFYCQLPDEVAALDAVEVVAPNLGLGAITGIPGWIYENTVGTATDAMHTMYNGFVDMVPYGAGGGHMYREKPRSFERFSMGLDVQSGLHALTGRSATVETANRLAILRGIDPAANPLEFGIALHAFGDSFAHRDDAAGRMFPPMIGHGGESVQSRMQRKVGIDTEHHHVDAVGPFRAPIYREYILALHELFTTRFSPGHRPGFKLTATEAADALVTIVAPNDTMADSRPERLRQVSAIRALAQRAPLSVTMDPYAPETLEKAQSLDEFRPPPDFTVSQIHINQALACGRWWNMPGADFTSGLRVLP
ncbi:DUF4157 domain-containing protein [Muricoccus radiodurans]|uniref:eCIS core domain-containing protein n=1 Tax=Muricoccus radiodurans TaxID=2231721 RepID=UPI003CEFB405